jgi:chromate transport protein ChrA
MVENHFPCMHEKCLTGMVLTLPSIIIMLLLIHAKRRVRKKNQQRRYA